MKKIQLTLAFAGLLAIHSFAQSSQVIKEYVLKYKDIAIEEMRRTGVPAAITLAQGIHETSAGQSDLVIKSNNHFGIKCKAEWIGPSVSPLFPDLDPLMKTVIVNDLDWMRPHPEDQ